MRALAFSADGRTLATTAGDGRVLVWDVRSGEVRETLTGHTGAVNTLEVSDDGRTLYTAGLDGRIIVWDIAGDRRLARPFRGGRSRTPDYPPPLAISPSGRTVAAGLADGGVRLHDARTLRRLRDLPGIEDGPVTAVEFSPDGRSIAVTGEAGTVELRDAATGRRMRPPLRLGAPAQAMAFSPDGGRLAVADIEGNLRVLDLGSGKVRRRAPRLAGFTPHLSYQPRWRDARDRARRTRHRAARQSVSTARRPPALPETRVGGFASRRTAGCWPSPPRITRSCGTWPSAGESARR